MTRRASNSSSRPLLAIGGAFLLAHSILGTVAPRDEQPTCAICVEYKLDPNTASREDLMLLPGIGPALAEGIIGHRAGGTSQPVFRCAEDLDSVSRIGPAVVERLRPHMTFPEPSAAPSK